MLGILFQKSNRPGKVNSSLLFVCYLSRMSKRILFLAILFCFSGFILSCQNSQPQVLSGTVVHVLDGDTYDILTLDKDKIRIRMEGIDTPEKGMPYYRTSKRYLSSLCMHQVVKLEVTGTDRYGRTLAYAYLEDGRELSREMLKAGLAWHYKKYNSSRELSNLELDARKQGIKIWSDPNPMPPWVNKSLHRKGISTKDSFDIRAGEE